MDDPIVEFLREGGAQVEALNKLNEAIQDMHTAAHGDAPLGYIDLYNSFNDLFEAEISPLLDAANQT